MMMQETTHPIDADKQLVVLIDDDKLNNMVCEQYFKLVGNGQTKVVTFTDPERGLQFLHHACDGVNECHAIVLLDLNMPEMSGWEFLEQYSKLDASLREAFSIFILSSSMDPADHRRAMENPDIEDFIVKPLTRDVVRRLLVSAAAP